MIRRCDLVPQYEAYKKEIHEAMERVLLSGRYVLADEGTAFEKEFAAYLHIKQAAGVGNATDGLIMALRVLGVGPGDEVITTPFSAIPTVCAIVASGATPVFADIDAKTFLVDLNNVKKSITSKTKAVMPVHLFGNVVDIKKLRTIVGPSIAIVEDAAQAHGSKIGPDYAGTLGDMGVFSFYPTKNLGGYGDGGAIVSNNAAHIEKVKLLRMYGMIDKDHIAVNGINTRLDELQAAILRVKLKYLDAMNQKRTAIANYYRQNLPATLFEHQNIPPEIYSNYHVFVSRVKKDRDALIQYLDKAGIQTNIYYPVPFHLQEANRSLGKKKGDYPIAEKLCDEVIALPLYPELEERDYRQVVEKINDFIRVGAPS